MKQFELTLNFNEYDFSNCVRNDCDKCIVTYIMKQNIATIEKQIGLKIEKFVTYRKLNCGYVRIYLDTYIFTLTYVLPEPLFIMLKDFDFKNEINLPSNGVFTFKQD